MNTKDFSHFDSQESPQRSASVCRRYALFIRTLLAGVAWLAVVLQLWLSVELAVKHGDSVAVGVAEYARFFSTLTSLFIALVAIAPTVPTRIRAFRWFATPMAAGCAMVSGVLVLIAYHFLLRKPSQGIQGLSDLILHYAVPVVMVVYGLQLLHAYRLPWSSPFLWCSYPVGYFIYALIRGALTGSYPYWFFNAAEIGYRSTVVFGLGLLGLFVVLSYAFLGLSRAPTKWSCAMGEDAI
jgi:hypothetical protein